VTTLKNLKQLKKLNMSSNTSLSSESMLMIIQGLTNLLTDLQEIDLSKLQINSVPCFRSLSAMIGQNKNLRSLGLMRVGATDDHASLLVDKLSKSLNIEMVRLDYNNLGGSFMEKYCSKLAQVPFTVASSGQVDLNRNQSASLLATESDEHATQGALSRRSS